MKTREELEEEIKVLERAKDFLEEEGQDYAAALLETKIAVLTWVLEEEEGK